MRVLLWHTWSWAWLSWIPAMPAKFFTNGALLDRSIERHGWSATVRNRARRLLIPFWFYGAMCWVAMLATGWRPEPADAVAWILPVIDPSGAADLPGLWIPLWYIRAYVWFVILSGVFKWIERRVGMWLVIGTGVASVAAFTLSRYGPELPFAVGDLFGYLPFVTAGMVYNSRGRLGGPRVLPLISVVAFVLAIITWRQIGPADAVVNRSYLLMLLVGTAGISAAVSLHKHIVGALENSSRISQAVTKINSRALTIYLWQGFGLVAADRLVQDRIDNGVLSATLSLTTVVVIVVGATILFGPLEDIAARRTTLPELLPGLRPRLAPTRGAALRWSACLAAPLTVVVSIKTPVDPERSSHAPLSGHAVVARAGIIEDALSSDPANATGHPDGVVVAGGGAQSKNSAVTVESVLRRWARENRSMLSELGSDYVDVVAISPDGTVKRANYGEVPGDDELLLWWSMTKTVTATWLMRLTEAGVVSPSDKLAKWVPEVPNAKRITLEQLARHTSGIPSALDSPLLEANPKKDIGAYKRNGRLASTPGTGFEYSRIGYELLALALERASSVTWVDAVNDMARQADATVQFDSDLYPQDDVTDPDGHGYKGALWASGGIVSSVEDAAKLFHWIFTEGLQPDSVDQMTSFDSDPQRWFYGLGLVPLCPCEIAGERLQAKRFGLDSATGSFAVDRDGSVVVVRPKAWFRDKTPVKEFYELESRMLDSLVAQQPG